MIEFGLFAFLLKVPISLTQDYVYSLVNQQIKSDLDDLLKGVFAKNERGYRLNAKSNCF